MKIKLNNSELVFVVGKNVEVLPLILSGMYFNPNGVVESGLTKRKIYYYRAKAGVTYNMSVQCSSNPTAVAGTIDTVPQVDSVATTYQTGLGTNPNVTITPTTDCYIFLSLYDSSVITNNSLKFLKNYQE